MLTPLLIIIKMCLESEKVYRSDQEYLDEVKEVFGLRSRAMALKIIIRRVRQLAPNEKQIREELI